MNWRKWEEIKYNMWGSVENRSEALLSAIEFTGQHELYGHYMLRVIREWPNSCENALTDYTLNRKAWLGHAACALALKIPEDIVRAAWSKLSDEQRLLANKQAERAIRIWTLDYVQDRGVYNDLGGPMLF